ncbi:hypothetical protein HK098_000020 [Nowakowskiella sp. JEL0407]|nr:hypothetical protein HK098_000020 [Nowakowskiella sp. JEL0407]
MFKSRNSDLPESFEDFLNETDSESDQPTNSGRKVTVKPSIHADTKSVNTASKYVNSQTNSSLKKHNSGLLEKKSSHYTSSESQKYSKSLSINSDTNPNTSASSNKQSLKFHERKSPLSANSDSQKFSNLLYSNPNIGSLEDSDDDENEQETRVDLNRKKLKEMKLQRLNKKNSQRNLKESESKKKEKQYFWMDSDDEDDGAGREAEDKKDKPNTYLRQPVPDLDEKPSGSWLKAKPSSAPPLISVMSPSSTGSPSLSPTRGASAGVYAGLPKKPLLGSATDERMKNILNLASAQIARSSNPHDRLESKIFQSEEDITTTDEITSESHVEESKSEGAVVELKLERSTGGNLSDKSDVESVTASSEGGLTSAIDQNNAVSLKEVETILDENTEDDKQKFYATLDKVGLTNAEIAELNKEMESEEEIKLTTERPAADEPLTEYVVNKTDKNEYSESFENVSESNYSESFEKVSEGDLSPIANDPENVHPTDFSLTYESNSLEKEDVIEQSPDIFVLAEEIPVAENEKVLEVLQPPTDVIENKSPDQLETSTLPKDMNEDLSQHDLENTHSKSPSPLPPTTSNLDPPQIPADSASDADGVKSSRTTILLQNQLGEDLFASTQPMHDVKTEEITQKCQEQSVIEPLTTSLPALIYHPPAAPVTLETNTKSQPTLLKSKIPILASKIPYKQEEPEKAIEIPTRPNSAILREAALRRANSKFAQNSTTPAPWSSVRAPKTPSIFPRSESQIQSHPDFVGEDKQSETTRVQLHIDGTVIETLQTQVQYQEAEIRNLQALLQEKNSDIEILKEEINMLERVREQDGAARRSRLATLSDGDLGKIEKEIMEQENLIHGYQVENEKLLSQVKDLKNEMKEIDKRSFLKNEQLQRENTTLRNQLTQLENRREQTGLASAKLQLRVEELENEMKSSAHKFAEREESLDGEVTKLKALLSSSTQELNRLKREELGKLTTELSIAKSHNEELEHVVRQLEEKSVIYDAEFQEDAVVDLEKTIERIESLARTDEVNYSDVKIPKSHQIALNRIKELEKEVEELKKFKKSGNAKNIPDLVKSAKNLADESMVRKLSDQVKKLEIENETLSAESEKRINDLREEYDKVKAQFEEKVSQLQSEIQRQKTQINAFEETNTETNTAKARAQELEQQFEKLLETYTERLKQQETRANEEAMEQIVQIRVDTLKQRETLLQKRIVEFERLVEEQNMWISSLKKEKIELDAQLRNMTAEKDLLIENYEKKILELQKQYHDDVFSVEEQKNLNEIRALKIEVEDKEREIVKLQNQLVISEETRKAVHETTISILRQTQEGTAKIALEHHERALALLRNESGTSPSTFFNMEVKSLRKRLIAAEKDAEAQKNKSLKLERQLRELKESRNDNGLDAEDVLMRRLHNENNRLMEELKSARKTWTFDRVEFNKLEQKVVYLEERHRQHLVNDPKSEYVEREIANVKRKYQIQLQRKDSELVQLQKELLELMDDIILIQQMREQ